MSSRRAYLFVPAGVVGGSFLLGIFTFWMLPVVYGGRVLPGVTVSGVPVGGKPPGEVLEDLQAAFDPSARRLRFAVEGRTPLERTYAQAGVTLDLDATIARVLALGRGQAWEDLRARVVTLTGGQDVSPAWRVDRGVLQANLERALGDTLHPSTEPTWDIESDGSFAFQPGTPGVGLALDDLALNLEGDLARGGDEPLPVPLVTLPPVMADADARVAGVSVSRLATSTLTLVAGEVEVSVPSTVLQTWATKAAVPELDPALIERYLRATVASRVARPPRQPQFEVSGNRATAFLPSEPGRELLVPESVTGIIQGLAAGADRVKLVTKPVPPTAVATPLMEQYGVRQLVARGESDFAGSPKNRIHNIRVGAQKYHGLLVPPGGEFSFNENLGPVEASTGFLPELVILANVTTPQYGGGLCQVSTTMFRSAMNAGLPITARKNHAYAVSYYGTPGFDATIYPPNPDLRFRNDTPGHLLVQMKLEGTKLAFELWGTSDGRQVEVLGPFPFDRKGDGSVKARLVRKVTRAGQEERAEWFSSYKSPKLFPKVLAANAERETWEVRVQRIAEKDRRAREEFERKKAELLRKQPGTSNQGRGTRPTPRPSPTSTPELRPE